MSSEDYREMVNKSGLLPQQRQRMLSLTPRSYTGLAAVLANNINEQNNKK